MKKLFIILGLIVFLSGCMIRLAHWRHDVQPTLHYVKRGHVDDWPALFFIVSNPGHVDRDLLVVCWTGDHCHSRDNCVIEPVYVPQKSDAEVAVVVKPGRYTCRLAERSEHRKKTGWMKCPTDDVKCQPDPLRYDVNSRPLRIPNY